MFSTPKNIDHPAGQRVPAGNGFSTVIADFDFETYSEAGYVWDYAINKFVAPKGSKKKGLLVVGLVAYAQHPTTEILCLAYNLKNGQGPKQWVPGMPPPQDLLEHIVQGKLLEAWNVSFERWIWHEICHKRYGWPNLNPAQLRCAMAKARAIALPGSLDAAGEVLQVQNKKNKDGKRLITKFSMPRNPTKTNTSLRVLPQHDPVDALNLYSYNLQDILAESEISQCTPDLSPDELRVWQIDQAINFRGVQIDMPLIDACIKIIEQAYEAYNAELCAITGGAVTSASKVSALLSWFQGEENDTVDSMDKSTIETLLKEELSTDARRALEIRALIASASVKKLYAMKHQASHEGRLHEMFLYHGARTGRATGTGPQPQNLPSGAPNLQRCEECMRHYADRDIGCLWCGANSCVTVEWSKEAAEDALEIIKTGSLKCVEYYFKNAVAVISGSLRGLFIAKEGHDLISSDYNSIEAVVLAALAGEEWRLEVFRTHGKIYEMSAAKITGVPFEDFMKHKKETGSHHPHRKIGKIAELASGFGGWIGAWRRFGVDESLSDEQLKEQILAWRNASPAIVNMWGGQIEHGRTSYYGLEGAAIQAVLSPGTRFSYRGITYYVAQDILYCELLSGRCLVYHKPRLSISERRPDTLSLTFEGWNTNPLKGKTGWVRIESYGGKLTENVVQATARDIFTAGMVNLENAGYFVVLHVHDEIIAEVPQDFGSVEEFEKLMCKVPNWAKDWPIKATGGWRGKRYGK